MNKENITHMYQITWFSYGEQNHRKILRIIQECETKKEYNKLTEGSMNIK